MKSVDIGERAAVSRPGEPRRGTPSGLQCVRCGYTVPDLMMGCKDPCRNCRFLYPVGDCSD